MAKCKNYNYVATSLEDAVNHSMKTVVCDTTKNGNRSTEKTAPIHSFIAADIRNRFYEKYGFEIATQTQVDPDGEYNLTNDINERHNCDISVFTLDHKRLIHVLEFKWFLRSYGKNAANYLKGMRGETASIHWEDSNPNVSQIIFAMDWMPNTNDSGIVSWENMNHGVYENMMSLHYGDSCVPESMLIGILNHAIDPRKCGYKTYSDYQNGFIASGNSLALSEKTYSNGHFHLNDYNKFIDEIVDMIYDKMCEDE